MQMPGRSFSSSAGYRYGYQGSEKDNEVTSGNGNHYTTYYRGLDVRLARWWSTDPVVQPWQSPYNSMNSNPIRYNDPMGDKIRGNELRKQRRMLKRREIAKNGRAGWRDLKRKYRGNKRHLLISAITDKEIAQKHNLGKFEDAEIQTQTLTGLDDLGRRHGQVDHLYYIPMIRKFFNKTGGRGNGGLDRTEEIEVTKGTMTVEYDMHAIPDRLRIIECCQIKVE